MTKRFYVFLEQSDKYTVHTTKIIKDGSSYFHQYDLLEYPAWFYDGKEDRFLIYEEEQHRTPVDTSLRIQRGLI